VVWHGINLQSQAIGEFCVRWRIRELAAFGSILRDDFGPNSDVDLLVTFEENAPWDLLDLFAMQDEAASILGRPVDLVSRRGIENAANRIVKAEVLGAAERVYAKD
jgi:predicted nucleotidyltransferase